MGLVEARGLQLTGQEDLLCLQHLLIHHHLVTGVHAAHRAEGCVQSHPGCCVVGHVVTVGVEVDHSEEQLLHAGPVEVLWNVGASEGCVAAGMQQGAAMNTTCARSIGLLLHSTVTS